MPGPSRRNKPLRYLRCHRERAPRDGDKAPTEQARECAIPPDAAPAVGEWMQMADGDMIAVISDGVLEPTNPGGEQFGTERVADVLLACRDLSAAEIRQALVERLSICTQGRAADHDRTVVIVKRTG